MNDEKPSPRADLFAGLAFLAGAIAIVVAALRMDRLERLEATIYTAPGLVPDILGVLLALMAAILIARAMRAGALSETLPSLDLIGHWRLGVALVLCLGYALGLVGWGLPFWLGSAIFVSLFLLVFQFEDRRRAGTLGRGVVFAIGYGLVTGLAIHHLFQDVFLVRLP